MAMEQPWMLGVQYPTTKQLDTSQSDTIIWSMKLTAYAFHRLFFKSTYPLYTIFTYAHEIKWLRNIEAGA